MSSTIDNDSINDQSLLQTKRLFNHEEVAHTPKPVRNKVRELPGPNGTKRYRVPIDSQGI